MHPLTGPIPSTGDGIREEIRRLNALDSLAKSGPAHCPRGYDDTAFRQRLDELYEELRKKR